VEAETDIEDLGFNSFHNHKKVDNGNVFTELPFYFSEGLYSFPEFLKTEIGSSMACQMTIFQDFCIFHVFLL
jgi:hypothetical protein